MAAFGLLCSIFVVAIVSTFANGYVFSVLWGWFVAGVFGLPVLSIGQSIGFAMAISFLFAKDTDAEDERSTQEKLIAGAVFAITKPVVYLAIGAIVHLFVR
jgi:hypothetical protein